MQSKATVEVETTVTVNLDDNTHATFSFKYGEDTVASKLAKQPLYCTYKTWRRTSGPAVSVMLVSYGEEIYKQCRIVDITLDTYPGFFIEECDADGCCDPTTRFVTGARSITNIRTQLATAPKWTSKFRAIIAQVVPHPIKEVTLDKTSNALGLDSLDEVELVMALESAYNIEIPDSHAENWKTVNDVVTYLNGLNIVVREDAL
jgi:acyl carrier protein